MARLYQNTVLLVDDETSITDVLSLSLENKVAKILTACDGKKALDILRFQPVDLLISDIRMPHMDGITLLSHIKEEKIRVLPILFSGNGDYDLVKKAIQLGAYDYLEKPIDIELFSNRIYKALDKINLDQLQNELLKYFLLYHTQQSIADFDQLTDSEKETLLQATLGIFKLKILNQKAS